MKTFLIILVPFLIYGCHSTPTEDAPAIDNPVEALTIEPTTFDSTLAKQLWVRTLMECVPM